VSGKWTEVGDRVFVRRYRFVDQDITVVLGGDAALLVDTRSTHVQAREILDDLHELGSPRVGVVVNTHGHGDHCFGNHVFRPAPIWGHERCVAMIHEFGEESRASYKEASAEIAADLDEVVLDPPDRTFTDRADLDLDGRRVELRYLGRGHTDNDIVVAIPDADVLCVGDLLEEGAPPWFGDSYPLDWPVTAEAILALVGERTVVVPGHGGHGGRTFVERSIPEFHAVVDLARRVHAGEITLAEAVAAAPYPAKDADEPLERALAQLRGELD
jgi:glyoxylase-like metal-dependent hydrolase (beta-lactamase superfamily II)